MRVIDRIVSPLGRRIDESLADWWTRACRTAPA